MMPELPPLVWIVVFAFMLFVALNLLNASCSDKETFKGHNNPRDKWTPHGIAKGMKPIMTMPPMPLLSPTASGPPGLSGVNKHKEPKQLSGSPYKLDAPRLFRHK